MAFLDKVTQIAKTVGEKTGDAVETGRISLKIAQEEGRMKDAKLRLGELMFQAVKDGAELSAEAMAVCREILAMEENIAALEAEKDAVNAPQEAAAPESTAPEAEPEKTCPACRTAVPADAKFCGNCGHKFE